MNGRIVDTDAMKARADLETIRQALEAFKKDHGRYPSGEESLDILVATPTERGYLLTRHAITDPWGDPYVYRPQPQRGGFQLYSRGPNQIDDGERGDDIAEPLE